MLIWQLADGSRSVLELVDELAYLFKEVSRRQLAEDVCELLSAMVTNGIIEFENTGPPAPSNRAFIAPVLVLCTSRGDAHNICRLINNITNVHIGPALGFYQDGDNSWASWRYLASSPDNIVNINSQGRGEIQSRLSDLFPSPVDNATLRQWYFSSTTGRVGVYGDCLLPEEVCIDISYVYPRACFLLVQPSSTSADETTLRTYLRLNYGIGDPELLSRCATVTLRQLEQDPQSLADAFMQLATDNNIVGGAPPAYFDPMASEKI